MKRVLLMVLAVALASCSADSADSAQDVESTPKLAKEQTGAMLRFYALEACKPAVLAQLKAPSTAKFRNPAEDDGEVRVGRGENSTSTAFDYTVFSTVDAENSFGAPLRSSFVCSVVHDREEDTWTVVEAQLSL